MPVPQKPRRWVDDGLRRELSAESQEAFEARVKRSAFSNLLRLGESTFFRCFAQLEVFSQKKTLCFLNCGNQGFHLGDQTTRPPPVRHVVRHVRGGQARASGPLAMTSEGGTQRTQPRTANAGKTTSIHSQCTSRLEIHIQSYIVRPLQYRSTSTSTSTVPSKKLAPASRDSKKAAPAAVQYQGEASNLRCRMLQYQGRGIEAPVGTGIVHCTVQCTYWYHTGRIYIASARKCPY